MEPSWTPFPDLNKYRANESVLKEADTELNLFDGISAQQVKFVGHVMRGHSLDHILMTGKMNRKRVRGRQREKIWNRLGRPIGRGKGMDLIAKCENRETWRDMVTNPTDMAHHDDNNDNRISVFTNYGI